MRKIFPIADYKIDELLQANPSEDYHWDEDKIIYNGVLVTRQSVAEILAQCNAKMTPSSAIKKDPQFDYSFMDELYIRLDQFGLDHIGYPTITNIRNRNEDIHYQIDMNSFYTHVIQFEKMPIDGRLYMEPSPDRLNFYVYSGEAMTNHCIITDDLKDFVEANDLGDCEFIFSTDYCVGCNIGKRFMEMAYKHKGTKAELKQFPWGYYQKRYLEYFEEEDAYAKRPQFNKEPLMIAIFSQMAYITFTIRECIGDYNGLFNKDAYFFDADPDIEKIKKFFSEKWPNYDYRIIDNRKPGTEDKHGEILYKSYPDLPDAPRSHHKKKDFEVVYPVAKEAKIW